MKTAEFNARTAEYSLVDGATGFVLNVAGMDFSEGDLAGLSAAAEKAHRGMQDIESGKIKNPDEQRKVTHFTNRIDYPRTELFRAVREFAGELRAGAIRGCSDKRFDSAVINGIGGSALGPQLVQFALNGPYWNELSDEKRGGYLKIYFTDNTDTAGIADILAAADLEKTLVLSISKSGGTQETRNNMLAFKREFEGRGLDFAKHACAVTMKDSKLDRIASEEGWLRIFHMAESIGGRTSETSVVGHLPAAFAGIDFKTMLAGACKMDEWTRNPGLRENPSYLLAAMWYIAGGGKGDRNMVIVPYSDRLVLLSKYLQQLVMESLGKKLDLDGKLVNQGLNVFGNKGGTDAHAFIQQLNDGRDDFFVTFIEILRDAMEIPFDQSISMGDYLHGFQAGLARALREKGRQTIEIRISELNAFTLGMLIALYERAVAYYAELININAFHQPGVQAYKLASNGVIELQIQLEKELAGMAPFSGTPAEIVEKAGMEGDSADVEGMLAKFAANSAGRSFPGFSIVSQWDNSRSCTVYEISEA